MSSAPSGAAVRRRWSRALRRRAPRAVPAAPELPACAVQLRGLQVRFGSVTALDGVDLDVTRGQVVGVLGRRGAGTSTTLAAVAGLLTPTAGTVRVFGHDPVARPDVVHRLVAVLPAGAAPFPRLTVREHLQLWASVHAAPLPLEEVLALAGLAEVAGRRSAGLDADDAQRLLLALTFVGGTPLVVLDEPAERFTPAARAAAEALVRHRVAAGGTVLAACADATRAAGLCDRVAVLRRGRLLAVASPAHLVERYAPDGGAAVLVGDPAEASALSSAAPGATFQRCQGGTLVEVPGCDPDRLADLLRGLTSVLDVRHHEGSLADALRRATADRRAQQRPGGPS